MSNKTDLEDLSAIQFLSNLFPDFDKSQLIKIPEHGTDKRPDYYYKKSKVLFEIKALYELEDNKESARWSSIVNGIKNLIIKNPEFQKLNGLYSVDSHRNITIPRDKHQKCGFNT